MKQQIDFKEILSTVENYDLFLFDMWGVIIEGDLVYPGVVESINKIIEKKQTFFVTNAPRPAFQVYNNLINWGIKNIEKNMVFTSGDMATQIITENLKSEKPIIYHLGEDRNQDIFINFDYTPTTNLDKANVVLISLYRDDHENIREFDDLLSRIANKNILTICSNPDTTIPLNGKTRYHAGYFSEIIENQGGKVIYSGKPKSVIYEAVFKASGDISKDRILMVGDTLETDIQGAEDAGLHSALVMTGNAEKFHIMHDKHEDKIKALSEHINKSGIVPTFITSLS